jgi:hypothetical protein
MGGFMTNRWRGAALVAVLCACSRAAAAQGKPAVVVGRVVDQATSSPLPGVVVSAVTAGGSGLGAVTDADGSFTIQVSAGRLVLGLAHAGFRAGGVDTTVAESDTLRLGIAMVAAPKVAQPLAAVAVVGKSVALPTPFLRRKDLHTGGHFYMGDDIEKLRAPDTPGLLQRVSGGMLRGSVLVTQRSQGSLRTSGECPYSIIFNDMKMPTDFDLRGVHTTDIIGLEVYNGPSSIPLELGGTRSEDQTCGVVVIWTKGVAR